MRSAAVRLVLAALAVIGCGEVVARVVEQQVQTPQLLWYDEATQLKVAQMENRGPTTLVVAGTSMAWQGLVPSILLDGEAYNAGLAGGVPQVMEPWLLGPVRTELQPTVVVWGLSSLDFSDVYGDTGRQIYREAPATRPGMLAATDRLLRRWSALIRQRPVLRNPSLLIGDGQVRTAERFHAAQRILGTDGERQDFAPAVTDERASEVRARISPYRVDRDDVAAIVRTIEALRVDGTVVVLVEMPVPPRFLALYDDGAVQHRVVGDLLEAIGSELDVPVLSTSSVFTDDDFVDYTHLTASAAAEFSIEVSSQLQELGW